ncbi:MAG: TlpA disulfide reductase family protein [Candidatus Poribacteria bacterium]|nr:TlpA disulfide reductase family protein [Candidatus Poribacteria bacterium]
MSNKYDSTDFWYTFVNSLYNFGLSSKSGISEIDEEMQEKLLAYFRTKIEEGVVDGVTALPPGVHNYFWRLPKEMLPKLRSLAEGYLETDPNNGAAALFRTMVELSDWDAKSEPYIDEAAALLPNDPCMNLVVINEFRMRGRPDIDEIVKVLSILENLYKWAMQQDNTARYQEARSFYIQHRITPYTVYKHLRDALQGLKQRAKETASLEEKMPQIEKYKSLIQECRDLVDTENAAFRKNFGQQSEEQQDLADAVADNTDIWEAYLKSLEDRKNAPPRRLTPNDQEQLLEYLKTRIKEGIVEGKTTLPAQLQRHITNFPEVMHMELREFAEEALESQPKNGAAMKMLAIIVWDGKRVRYGESDSDLTWLEQAMVLTPNDPETCFFAISHYDESYDPLFKLTLTALEQMFGRTKQLGESELYRWLKQLYKEVGRTPCHIYRNLMKNPEGNAELIAKCKPLIEQMLDVFQQQLTHDPDDWYSLRGLGDIYEVLGEIELAQKYPWKGHSNIETIWNQKAWVGRRLPDFSATTHDGTSITASDYKGKFLLLSFCAKWCGFCASEIPYIKEAYKEHHHNGFEVIGISLDKNEAELKEYIEEHNITWPQIYDGKGWNTELARYFGINGIPSQWLIDRDGKVISVSTSEEQLSQLVKWTETTRIGNVIPDFTAVDVDGNSISSAAFRGKVALIHFGYIRQELELTIIDTLYEKHHKNGFEVIGVNIGGWRDEDVLRDIVHKENHQGHYIYAAHDGEHAALVEQFGFGHGPRSRKVDLPAFILIDTNGKVIDARSGKVHSPEAWAAKLEKLVAAHL